MVFWVVVVAIRRTDLPEQVRRRRRLLPVANVVVVVGSLGVIIFGVWLAIALDGIEVWNGWVIAAIVLWASPSETGRRTGPEFAPCVERARRSSSPRGRPALTRSSRSWHATQQGLLLHSIATVAVLLILVDMIWKPGA